HTGGANLNQWRASDAVTSRHSGENEGLLGVLGIALPSRNPGGLLCRVVQQPTHLLCIQPRCAARRRRRPERPGGAMNTLVALIVEGLSAKSGRHTACK